MSGRNCILFFGFSPALVSIGKLPFLEGRRRRLQCIFHDAIIIFCFFGAEMHWSFTGGSVTKPHSLYQRREWIPRKWNYTVIHLLVVDVSCVLVRDHAHWLGPKQNTRNIYHKQMNNDVIQHSSRRSIIPHCGTLSVGGKPLSKLGAAHLQKWLEERTIRIIHFMGFYHDNFSFAAIALTFSVPPVQGDPCRQWKPPVDFG